MQKEQLLYNSDFKKKKAYAIVHFLKYSNEY